MAHTPTISLVVIHRRASGGLARLVRSVLDQVDEVVLVNTGPADDDAESWEAVASIGRDIQPECERRGIRLRAPEYHGVDFLWNGKRYTSDFAAARNFAAGFAGKEWELVLDADDTLEPGPDAVPLRDIIEQAHATHFGVAEIALPYRYGAGVVQDRVRLWRRDHGWEWAGALHEERQPLAPGRGSRCSVDESFWTVVHHGDAASSRARNAALLEYLRGRVVFTSQMTIAWLATLLDRGDEVALREVAAAHLERDASRDAKALVCSLRAEACRRLGLQSAALEELGSAVALVPHDRARWAELGLEWASRGEQGFENAAAVALSLAYEALPVEPWHYLAPSDWFEGEGRQRAEEFLGRYRRKPASHRPAKRTKQNMKRLDFLVASPAQGWGPWTRTVVGGSELAVLEVVPRLQSLGLDVHVYATGLGHVDETWRPLDDFEPADSRGALVVWRDARRIPGCKGFGHPVWLWAHDIPEVFAAEGLHAADLVFALSEHHASRFQRLGVGKTRIVRSQNGLNSPEVAVATGLAGKRDPHRAVYCSAANRGLLLLLSMWPAIRRRVPDARLEVAYGLELFNRPDTPERLRELPRVVVRECERLAEAGVTFRGAVPHGELLRLLGSSGVLAYPCTFEEIFCIAAVEAQAMGCVPVTTDSAALAETVHGGVKVPLPQLVRDCCLTPREVALGEVWTFQQRSSAAYVDAVVAAMTNPPDRAKLPEVVLSIYDWGNVAAHFASALEMEKKHGSLRQGVSGP